MSEILSYPIPRQIAYEELLGEYKSVVAPVFNRDKVFTPDSVMVFRTTAKGSDYLRAGFKEEVVDPVFLKESGDIANYEEEMPFMVHLTRNRPQFVRPEPQVNFAFNLAVPKFLFGLEITIPDFAKYDRERLKWIKGVIGQTESGFGRINNPNNSEHTEYDRKLGNAFLNVLDGMVKGNKLTLVYDSDEEIRRIEEDFKRRRPRTFYVPEKMEIAVQERELTSV